MYVNYNQPNQKLEHVTVNQLEEYIEEQQFAAGSMLPKIEAAINFVNTNPKENDYYVFRKVYEALEEKAGTIISKQNVCMYV